MERALAHAEEHVIFLPSLKIARYYRGSFSATEHAISIDYAVCLIRYKHTGMGFN
jgi:hypothetical protein